MSTLGIASGTKCEGAHGAWFLHGVVMFLLSLDALATFNSTVFGAVDVWASDDGSRTEGLGDTEPMRECVEPENVEKNDFDEHARGAVIRWS